MIEMLRQMQHLFPQVDIKYDPDASSTTPIILHLRPHLDLLFSGKHQRLRTICVRKLRETNPPVTLRYKDTVLSSTDEVLRRVGVSRTFGPTYAGDDLRYPGVWFSFEEDGIGDGRSGAAHHEDRMQEVKRVLISQKEADEQGDALGEVVECPIMNGDISLAVVKVRSWLCRRKVLLNESGIGSRWCNVALPSLNEHTCTRSHRYNNSARPSRYSWSSSPRSLQRRQPNDNTFLSSDL